MRRPSVLFLITMFIGIWIQREGLNSFLSVMPYLPLLIFFKLNRRGVFIILAALVLGFGLSCLKTHQLGLSSEFTNGRSISLSGVLQERSILTKDSAFLLTQDPITQQTVKLFLKFPYGQEPPPWLGGEGVHINGVYRDPKGARNPGGFNEKQWLLTKSCAGIIQVKTIAKAPSLNQNLVLLKNKWADQLLSSLIQNTAFKQGPLAAGMLFGEDAWIDEETQDLYKLSGTNHILSISGAHFAIMLLWIHYLIQKRPFPYWGRKILVWLILTGFLWLIGWDIAAMRAFLMFFILDLMRMGFRQTDSLTSLTLTLIILLIYNPFSVYDVGLQLATMAMYGLIVISPQLTRGLHLQPSLNKQDGHSFSIWLNHRMREIAAVLIQSLVVCLCLLPILRNNFSTFTWWSILYNVPVSFMSAFILPLSMAQSLFFWNEAAVQALGILNGIILLGMTKLVSTVTLVASPKLLPALTGVNLKLYYGLLLIPLISKQSQISEMTTYAQRRSKTLLSCLVVLALLIVQSLSNNFSSHEMRAYFLDVGQGDSAVIMSPMGKIILVDTGLSKGMVQVSDSLFKMGIQTIDLVVLSHPHADHIGGMQRLLMEHDIKALAYYEGSYNPEETEALSHILKMANQLGIDINTWHKGNSIHIEEDLSAEVYFPAAKSQNEDTNDESLVFELCYKDTGILFTGDISSTVEYDIIEQIKSPAWVLKAPHHGSGGSNSEALLSTPGLALSVISVGEHNLYGHPKQETLDRYETAAVGILRTDSGGAVCLLTDGKGFRYQTQLGLFIDE